MFVTEVLLINVALPMALALVAIGLERWIFGLANRTRRNSQPEPQTTSDTQVTVAAPKAAHEPIERPISYMLQVLLGLVSVCLTFWLVFGLRNEFSFWSEEAWLRIPLATTIVGVVAAFTLSEKRSSRQQQTLAWSIRLAAVLVATWIIFPTGEAWEFLQPSRNTWFAAIAISTIAAWFLAEQQTPRNRGQLALAWIPLLAASAFLTSQSFLGITEPLLAVSSLLGCFGLYASRGGSERLIRAAFGPCLFGFVVIVAGAQFNSFLGLNNWLSYLGMFSPALVGLPALVPWGRPSPKAQGLAPHAKHDNVPSEGSRILRLLPVLLTWVLSAAVTTGIVAWTVIATGGEESWS